MVMRADEAGKDDPPRALDDVGLGESSSHLTGLAQARDPIPFGDDGGIPENLVILPQCDDDAILEPCGHGWSFPCQGVAERIATPPRRMPPDAWSALHQRFDFLGRASTRWSRRVKVSVCLSLPLRSFGHNPWLEPAVIQL